MTAHSRWHRIRAAFDELIDIPPENRATRLAHSCGDDAELRRSVQSLLDADKRTADPLQSAVSSAAEPLLIEHQDRLVGTRVGPYRIVSVLGQGGMSTVYRAERDDDRYRQTVAVKVLSNTVLHPRLRNRLHSERHILATLAHPCISRLIDSGELGDGTPYLVMEHVDGEPIDAYCDGSRLSVPGRLELFVRVCAAVQFAHRNLVVHRDLKAANILVTADRVPKLLDFGIAKLMSPEGLSHTLPVTRLQERMMTPENAAPEQVLGRPITTATDIYALGVLLYQLLSGCSPYRLLSYSQLQLERAICMDDPLRPSQVIARLVSESDAEQTRVCAFRGLSPQRLSARLGGDLDAIVAMAMRKEPDRRYQSVEALADDVNRHLRGEPVRARQQDWRYNGAKFLRRHVFSVLAVAAAFLTLAVIASITLWQNRRIELARQATEQERDRAQQVSAFLVDVFSEADPFKAQTHEATARELLDRGAATIMDNASLQPEVRAELLESIGLAYRRKGDSGRAIPLFERAVAIRRTERPTDSHRTAAALANLARALTDGGQLVSAEGFLRQALDLSRGADRTPSVETADILVQFAQFELNARSDQRRAMSLFTEALAIYRGTPGDRHLSVAVTLSGLAEASIWASDFVCAERYEREAIEIYRSTVSRNYPDHAVALSTLGYILTELGKYREARESLTEALQIEREVFGENSDRIAQLQWKFSRLYDRQGDEARAIEAIQRAVSLETRLHGRGHFLTGYHLVTLAEYYLKTGELERAEDGVREALAIFAASLPTQHLYVASARQTLGEILSARGQLAQAEVELRTAVDMNAALAGADQWRTARSEASLAWVFIRGDRAAEGERMLIAARARLLATVGATHPATQMAGERLVEYLRSRHRDAEAAEVLAGSGKL